MQGMLGTIGEVGFFTYFFSFYREFPLTVTAFCIFSFALGAVATFLVFKYFPHRLGARDQASDQEDSLLSELEEVPSIPGQSPPPGSRHLELITDGRQLPGVPAKAKSALETVRASQARQSPNNDE